MWKKRLVRWIKEALVMALLFMIVTLAINYLKAPEISSNILHDFKAMTTAKERVTQKDFTGRPMLLHFWGTWCPVCKTEIDNIEKIAKTDRVITVAVKSPDLHPFMKAHNLHFPVIDDRDGSLAEKFGITTFPTSLFIDAEGKISFVETGYTTTPGLRLRLWFLSHFR
ncbi:MAG: hypothetical protein B6D59_04745 [Campylobacteraceae bacterium 4484_4]|nr:MAG: hypothetical protein B6D59_04745 [Campylobacteraceae bacterium 4484_4]